MFIDGVTSYNVGGDPYGRLRFYGDGMSSYSAAAQTAMKTPRKAFTTASGSVIVRRTDIVTVGAGYASGGTPGLTYEYLGNEATLNLGTQNYANTSSWRQVAATASYAGIVASVLADTIIVNAEYINVNGLVQSGKDNYSLTLPSTLNTEIANIRNGAGGARLTLLSVSNQDFKVFYDRVENKIVVREVRVSGGNVQLTGRILSTGGGTIRVLSGYGTVNIDNQTTVDISIERIDTSKQVQGTLLLADKGQGCCVIDVYDGEWHRYRGTRKHGHSRLQLCGRWNGRLDLTNILGTTASRNLGTQNYGNIALWRQVPAAVLYSNTSSTYLSTDGTKSVKTGSPLSWPPGTPVGGVAGGVYEYRGTLAEVNLGTQNYANATLWKRLETPVAPVDGTYTPSSGWRYGFSVGMRTATRTTTTYGSSAWLSIDAFGRRPGNITSGPFTEVTSAPQLQPRERTSTKM